MKKIKLRKTVGAILLVLLFSAAYYPPLQQYIQTPDHVILFEGQHYDVPTSMPVISMDDDVISFSNDNKTIIGKKAKKTSIDFGINGFPLKTMEVTVLPKLKVVPGGQSIGVRVKTNGVLVVGHHLVETEDGELSPGEVAGIEVGDTILNVNGMKIKEMNEMNAIVQEAGEKQKALQIEIKRDGEILKKEFLPVKEKGSDKYRIGLYIRDSAAGVGTMTFYEPNSKKYGALGHVISDMDTKKPIEVNGGEVVSSKVTSIEKGATGEPGEKLARFSNNRKVLGDIQKNSSFGIFGKLYEDLNNGIWNEPLEIGLSHQVKEGPAQILTVVSGDEVKKYDIEIVSSTTQKFPQTKGMVIKVTDPELIDMTGGIIQGMSGSPIIQDNKLIGAVTHVFVNDPTSGYGCHIEWMLQEAGIDIYKEHEKAS